MMQVSNMFIVKFIFCPSKANFWRLKSTSLNRHESNQCVNTWQITDVKLCEVTCVTAETMQTYKIWYITMLTTQLYLKSSLNITQNEVPFINSSEAKEKGVTEQRTAKRQRIRIFVTLACDRSRADLSQLLN